MKNLEIFCSSVKSAVPRVDSICGRLFRLAQLRADVKQHQATLYIDQEILLETFE